MNGIDRCVWLSIRPGSTKQSVASITLAPSGASTLPTAMIVSPSIRTSPANSPSAVTIVPFAIRVVSLTACLLEIDRIILLLDGARVMPDEPARPTSLAGLDRRRVFPGWLTAPATVLDGSCELHDPSLRGPGRSGPPPHDRERAPHGAGGRRCARAFASGVRRGEAPASSISKVGGRSRR